MKKILLIGYAKKNVGDDIFISLFLNRYKNYKIDLYCPKRFSAPFKSDEDINVINADFFFNDDVDIDQYALCIYVGGSIFKENKYDFRMKEWLLKFILKCKKKDIPFYFISSNFGPYITDEYFNMAKKIFKNSIVNFRETYSNNLFKGTNYIPDLVLSMNFKPRETIKDTVGVSLINLYSKQRGEIDKYYFNYMRFLKNNIEKYIEEGKQVYLFSFCSYEADDRAITTLYSDIKSKYWDKIKIVNYDGNLNKFLDIYSSMEYMLGTRFHSMILSLLFKQKQIVCNYSTKISNIIKDYNLKVPYYEIDKNIDKLLIDLDSYDNSSNIDKITKLARDNFKEIDKFVKKNLQGEINDNYGIGDFYWEEKKRQTKKNPIKVFVRKVLKKLHIIKTKPAVPKPKKEINYKEENLKTLDNLLENGKIDKNTFNVCKKILGYDYSEIKVTPIKKGPLVSVVMATYKRDDMLQEAIDSLLNQSYKNIEIIIVDDYPDSKCKSMLNKKYKDYKNIKYYKNKVNSGAGITRMNAYNHATGKYIMFFDDDDILIDYDLVNKAVKEFEKNDELNLVGCNLFNYIEDTNYIKKARTGFSNLCNCIDYIKSFQIEYYKPGISSTMFRKSVLDESDFKHMEMMNDSSIFLNAMKKGQMIIFDTYGEFYRQHTENITLNLKASFIIDNLKEKKKIYEYLRDNNLIDNPAYWYYLQVETTFKYFINGTKPSKSEYKKLLKWCHDNMDDYYKKLEKNMNKIYHVLVKKGLAKKD